MTELRALDKALSALDKEWREADAAYTRADLVVQNAQSEMARCAHRLEELKKAKKCPTCGAEIKRGDIGKHLKEVADQSAELEKTIKAGVSKKVKDARDAVKRKLDQSEKDRKAFAQKCDKLEDARDFSHRRLVEVRGEVERAQAEYDRWKNDDNPYKGQLKDLRKNKAKLDKDLEDINADIVGAREDCERTKLWIKGFKDVRLYVIEEIQSELELATDQLLNDVGLVDWKITYSIERETSSKTISRAFNVFVKSPEAQDPVRWEVYSGGERGRLLIVGALALSDVLLSHAGITINMTALDEPTRGIGAGGIADLCETLADQARHLDRTIFLVDHHSIVSRRVAGVVTVVKDKDGSHIREQ